MALPSKPKVNEWYMDPRGETLKVVALDTDTIEVQHFDGSVEEFDRESWYGLGLEPIPEPEDWSGPFDDLTQDDFGDTYRTKRPEDWNGPADEMDYEE